MQGLMQILAAIVPLISAMMSPDEESRCLGCIRNVSSSLGVDVNKRCEGYYCGQFQISYTYWAEAGKPGNGQGSRDFEKCARDRSCAEQTVKAHFKKFKRDCNNDGLIDCLDMAALHRGGPSSCSSDWFYKSRFWLAFNKTICMTDRELATSVTTAPIRLDYDDQLSQFQMVKNQSLTSECLDCICDAISGCNTNTNNCVGGTVCGPFAISQAYWKDGRKPGANWVACARTKECSSVVMRNYMEKYKKDCNNDGYISCEDYAAIHRRGPRACSNKDLVKDHYWTKFLACRANQKPAKDVSLVKVYESPEVTSQSSIPTRAETTSIPPPISQHSTSKQTENSRGNIRNHGSSFSGSTQTRLSEFGSVSKLNENDLNNKLHNHKQQHSVHAHEYPNRNQHSNPQNYPSVSNQYHQAGNSANQVGSNDQNRRKQENSSERRDQLSHTNGSKEVTNSMHEMTANGKTTEMDPSLIAFSKPKTASPPIRSNGISSTTAVPQSKPSPIPTTTTTTTTYPATDAQPITEATTKPNQSQDSHQSNQSDISGDDSNEAQSQHVDKGSNQKSQTVESAPFPTNLGDEADYSGVDSGQMPDRVAFDRVVSGIMGNPDFSKSYPPLPDIKTISDAGKQEAKEQSEPVGGQDVFDSSLDRPSMVQKNQATGRPSTNSQGIQIIAALQRPITRASQKPIQAAEIGPMNSPLYPRSTTTSQAHPPVEKATTENAQSAFDSVIGLDSINMTSLFEDAGLNESSRIANECLECICDASSNCDVSVQCISKQREKNRCGLYMISWNQFQESDISLTSMTSLQSGMSEEAANEKMYYECSTDKTCAEKLIHLYIEKHQKDCNNDGRFDCYDIAAIHRVGPESCNSGKFLSSQYWKDFNLCYASDKLAPTTVQPLAILASVSTSQLMLK